MSRLLLMFSCSVSDHYYPQTKLGKGNVFTSVCQEFCLQGSMHGRGACMEGGMAGGMHGWGHVWQGGVCGGHVCGKGACMVGGVTGGMHGRGHAWWWCTWQGVCMAGETATAADGPHPAGMPFLFQFFLCTTQLRLPHYNGFGTGVIFSSPNQLIFVKQTMYESCLIPSI